MILKQAMLSSSYDWSVPALNALNASYAPSLSKIGVLEASPSIAFRSRPVAQVKVVMDGKRR